MGQFCVEWDLPADRDVATFWRHAVGATVLCKTRRTTTSKLEAHFLPIPIVAIKTNADSSGGVIRVVGSQPPNVVTA